MEYPSTSVSSSAHPVRVLHLTDSPGQIAAILDAQNRSGIAATVATLRGLGSQTAVSVGDLEPLSWRTAWGQVPRWREVLLEVQEQAPSQILHAHTFTAGMAAVRNFDCVVYQLGDTIDNTLERTALGDNTSWLRRSFHVAEDFILTRAAAVVVSSTGLREELQERGVAEENLFVMNPATAAKSETSGLVEQYAMVYRHARRRIQGEKPQAKLFLPPQYRLLPPGTRR